jgi:parvulin-like peptidyl-prolyl isomerase
MPPEARPFERGVIVGRVGSEVILYSEIGMGVEEIRAQYKDRAPADELERQILELLKERLKPRIETKLIYLDAKRTIPAENFRTLEKRVGEHFEKSEIQNMIKRGKLESRQQLEEKLEAMNTSLEQQKRVFTEQVIAQQWLKQQAKGDEEVTCADMLAYYQQHLADYDRPARARWEQLMVRFARFPGKAEAYRAIAEMGNQVLGGKDFAEVARAGSDGSTAPSGGLRDWTTRGSLVSPVLNEAIFALPPGELSTILEDEQGFHIVRVLEREEAHRIPFLEAQVEIRRKIHQQRQEAQEQTYLARLWKDTPVWTVFDGPAPYSHAPDAPAP